MTRSHSSLKSPAKARAQFEDFGFTEPEVFALPERGGVFEAYSFTAFILSDLGGPGERGRSSRAPNTPRLFLFLLEEKEAKDYLGGHP